MSGVVPVARAIFPCLWPKHASLDEALRSEMQCVLNCNGCCQALHDPHDDWEKLEAASGTKGCVYCGGLGHRIADCPKLAQNTRESTRANKDYFGKGGFGGEV